MSSATKELEDSVLTELQGDIIVSKGLDNSLSDTFLNSVKPKFTILYTDNEDDTNKEAVRVRHQLKNIPIYTTQNMDLILSSNQTGITKVSNNEEILYKEKLCQDGDNKYYFNIFGMPETKQMKIEDVTYNFNGIYPATIVENTNA